MNGSVRLVKHGADFTLREAGSECGLPVLIRHTRMRSSVRKTDETSEFADEQILAIEGRRSRLDRLRPTALNYSLNTRKNIADIRNEHAAA